MLHDRQAEARAPGFPRAAAVDPIEALGQAGQVLGGDTDAGVADAERRALSMQQAARVSDFTAYMYLGRLIEYGATDSIFIKPQRKETEDYITGRFG
jgi:hypothetical protein